MYRTISVGCIEYVMRKEQLAHCRAVPFYVPLLYTEMVQYSYFPRRAKIMKIAMASDHGGFALKASLMKHLDEEKIEYIDCGTYSEES